MVGIDTNIFLHFIVQDHSEQALKATQPLFSMACHQLSII